MKRGILPVAGCDEAGRGPLAGPVVAAAVILDPKRIPRGLERFQEARPRRRARSSTRRSAPPRRSRSRSRRRRASTATTSCAPRCGRWRARCAALPVRPQARLRRRPRPHRCRLRLPGRDQRRRPGASIAAASIVAKVTRDRLMTRLGAAHPGYGFERHMGYSVPEHFAALEPARADRPSPPLVRAGRRRLWRSDVRTRRSRRTIEAARVASLASAGLMLCRSGLRPLERDRRRCFTSPSSSSCCGSRPALVFWIAALAQAALWTLVPTLFYSAPPGDLPIVLAIGHEFQLGTHLGPPLAFWLAEVAFRLAGSCSASICCRRSAWS